MPPGTPPAAPEALETTSPGSLLVTLAWGSGEGEVGLAAPGEGLVRGPEALGVATSGRLAVLDSVNGRLLLLDAGGAFMGLAALPLAEPRFLAVTDELLYVLDCDADRRLVALDWTGAVLADMDLPELGDVVTGLFVTDRGPCVEVAHDNVFLVETADGALQSQAAGAVPMASPAPALGAAPEAVRPPTAHLRPLPGRPLEPGLRLAAKATFTPGDGPRVELFALDPAGLSISRPSERDLVVASGRPVEHLVSLDGDHSGGLVVGARLLNAGSEDSGGPSLWVGRFTSTIGRPAMGDVTQPVPRSATPVAADEALLLTDTSFAYVGQPYVVAPDGRIYQPVADERGYSIFVHSFASPRTPPSPEVRP